MKEKIMNFIKTPIISSIIIFILGAILFTNPEGIIKIVTYIAGGLFFFLGFIRFANYLGNKKKGVVIASDLNYAVIMMAMGILVVVLTNMIELGLRLIMGGFILYSGINRLSTSLKFKNLGLTTWKGHLIISIVIILLGLYIILKSNLLFSGIGLFMMFYSGLEMALYFLSNDNKNVIIK